MPGLADHLGAWEGNWKTFLRPDELYDESPIRATIARDDDAVVIEYSGAIAGDAVTGRLRWAEAEGGATVDWVDSWHTTRAVAGLRRLAPVLSVRRGQPLDVGHHCRDNRDRRHRDPPQRRPWGAAVRRCCDGIGHAPHIGRRPRNTAKGEH